MNNITNGFEKFMNETGGVGPAFLEAIKKLDETTALDEKTSELAYIAVLVTARMYGGLPFHIAHARTLGATTDEIQSAMLIPLPVLGLQITDALTYLTE